MYYYYKQFYYKQLINVLSNDSSMKRNNFYLKISLYLMKNFYCWVYVYKDATIFNICMYNYMYELDVTRRYFDYVLSVSLFEPPCNDIMNSAE